MASESDWQALVTARYASLTTFRKTGVGVPTAMWFAIDGDAVVMSTHADSGKVKRLRNDSRAELRPSSASGAVREGAPVIAGTAEVISEPAKRDPLVRLIDRKYGWQHRLLSWFERRRGGSATDRVIIRVIPN